MRISRLYVDASLQPGLSLELPSEASHYLANVLRLGSGDPLRIFNPSDGEFNASLDKVSRKLVSLSIADQFMAPQPPALHVQLGVGLSRGDRMDYLVQKATELGAMHISPLYTEFGEVRFKQEKRLDNKLRHWRQVAISACEQSGRISIPEIEEPRPLNDWLDSLQQPRRIILQPDSKARLGNLDIGNSLCLLSGPEGGFSEGELQQAEQAGFQSVKLGPRILRTETAPIAALAIVQSHYGDI